MKLFQITFFILILAGVSFAQNKIGFINGYEFYDEKNGIKKLVEAVNSTFVCYFDGLELEDKAGKLKGDIQALKIMGKPIEQKVLELSEVEEQLKKLNEERILADKKRYTLLVGPIEKQINDKLELFANKNGYKKIFNIVDLEDSLLYIDESSLVTKDFIKFCNEEFEKEKTSK